ncbi:leucyl/phenylalanyl-tRNA--protein transferase [Gammaproteobacteria bacterium]
MSSLYWIDPLNDNSPFPAVEHALTDPDGLLAAGGTLSPQRLMIAYRQGIFPWYNVDQPILWWAPDPRSVLYPERLKVSRSLHKTLRKGYYRVTFDTAFRQVIKGCAAPRAGVRGTWITPGMLCAYTSLHERGIAHSIEVWEDQDMVGGLYGIALGRVFYGESMFSRRTDASKVGFVYLVHQLRRWEFAVVDCQVQSVHLQSLGAETIPRREFTHLLDRYADLPSPPMPWSLEPDLVVSVRAKVS